MEPMVNFVKRQVTKYAVQCVGATHAAIMLGCIVGVILFHLNGPVSVSPTNGLINPSTSRPLRAITPFDEIPHALLWAVPSLSDLKEAKIEVEGAELRFDIVGGHYDSKSNTTTLYLSLNQTLVVSPDLSVLYDDRNAAVAISFDGLHSAEPGPRPPGVGASARRRLGKSSNKHHYTSFMKPPGFYGMYPYPYPYPYPVPMRAPPRAPPRPPLYTRPVDTGTAPFMGTPASLVSPTSQVLTLLRQPQIVTQPVAMAPAMQPVAMAPAMQPVAPAVQPSSAGAISRGDLDVISDLIKTSNAQLKEEILDLTINPKNVADTAITSETLVSMEALQILSNAVGSRGGAAVGASEEAILDLSFNPNNPTGSQNDHRKAYTTGFNDGYRDGFGAGVDTGEEVLTSLWCSIDGQHPLCSTAKPR